MIYELASEHHGIFLDEVIISEEFCILEITLNYSDVFKLSSYLKIFLIFYNILGN